MKLITLEEHYGHMAISKAGTEEFKKMAPHFFEAFAPGMPYSPKPGTLFDLGEGRIADMDANNITMQILSNTSAQVADASQAVEACRIANDDLAKAIQTYPDRFAGFAALPTAVPEACAEELRRAVKELGFVGAQISGRTNDKFLDDKCYEPLLEMAEKLSAPIYLHPGVPPIEVQKACYQGGLNPIVSTRMATCGWGWHIDAGTHMLHMVLSGTFDKFSKLQLILGHWGEVLPFFFDRIDTAFPPEITGLKKKPSEYLRENMYITPSGMFTKELLELCVKMVGVDRILYSVDYPYVPNEGAADFLLNSDLSEECQEKIACKNAEKLLRLSTKEI